MGTDNPFNTSGYQNSDVIPKASITPKTIQANGSNVWKNGIFVGNVSSVTWNSEDEKYIKFNVALGTWEFMVE